MRIQALEVAQRELEEAVGSHNDQAPGLGDAFLLETVLILAMAHLHRRPDYWRDRLR